MLTVDTEKVVINAAVDWLSANYSEFYDLQHVHADIVRIKETETTTYYTLAISCETKLKAASVEDLPFVKGMYEELSGRRTVSEAAKEAVDHYVDEIDFSDEYTNLSVDLVISVSDSSKGADLIMYYQDGMDTTLHPIEVLDLDSDQMYQAGKSLVDVVTADYESSTYSIKGYSSYDRVASRDYAWEWTGENVTSCYDDGPTCPIHQDRTQRNNDEYPYISNLKHDDCCDFVSQCMAKGGHPRR